MRLSEAAQSCCLVLVLEIRFSASADRSRRAVVCGLPAQEQRVQPNVQAFEHLGLHHRVRSLVYGETIHIPVDGSLIDPDYVVMATNLVGAKHP